MRRLSHHTHSIWVFVLCLLIGLPACLPTGCSPSREGGVETQGPTKTVLIGALLPLTGVWKNVGEEAKATLELVVEQANIYLTGAGADFYIELMVGDTRSDPAAAAQLLAAMKAAGVTIAIGPFTSNEAMACVDFANGNKMLLLSPASTSTEPALTRDDNLFRLAPNDDQQARAAAMLLSAERVKTALVVYIDDVYGKGLKNGFEEFFEDMGYTVPGIITIDADDADYTSEVRELELLVTEALKGEESASVAVFMILADTSAVRFLRQIEAESPLGQIRWYASEALGKSQALVSDPEAGAFAGKVGLTAFAFSGEDRDFLSYALLLENLVRNKLGRSPSSFAPPTSDALWLAAETFCRAAGGAEAGFAEVRKTLMEVSEKFFGASGFGMFDDNGDGVAARYTFYRVICEELDREEVEGEGVAGTSDRLVYRWDIAGRYLDEHYDVPRLARVRSLFPTGSSREEARHAQANNEAASDLKTGLARRARMPVSEETTVVIGALLPITGDLADAGKEQLEAMEKAMDFVNDLSEQNGWGLRFELRVEDTGTDPATALQKLRLLVGEGVKSFVGLSTSAEVEVVAPDVEEQGLIAISISSTADSLAERDGIFRLAPPDGFQASALVDMMAYEGLTEVVIVARDDTWGRGLNNTFTRALEDNHQGKVLGTVFYTPGTRDFLPIIEEAERLFRPWPLIPGATDTLAVLLLSFDEGVELMRQVPPACLLGDLRWITGDGLTLSKKLLEDPAALQFALKTGLTAPEFSMNAFDLFMPQTAVLSSMLTSTQGNGELSSYTANAFDSVILAALACLSVKDDPVAEKLAFAVQRQAHQTFGLSTPNLLDENGDRTSAAYDFYQVREQDDRGIFWERMAVWRNIQVIKPGYFPKTPSKGGIVAGTGWDAGLPSASIRPSRGLLASPPPFRLWGVPDELIARVHENQNCQFFQIDSADMKNTDLAGKKLLAAYLSYAKLTNANMAGVDAEEADMSFAEMSGVNLAGTILTGAELFRAILVDADLTGADLRRANLTRADMTGAILIGADLSGATWTDGKTVCKEGSIGECVR